MNLGLWFREGDRYIFYYINQRLKCSVLDKPMLLFTWLGSATFGLSFVTIITILGREQTRIIGLQAMLALVGSHLVVRLTKNLVGRCRPYLTLPGTRYLAQQWRDCSFPSGHTAASFSLAVLLALNFPLLTLPLVTVAGLTGISRMYVGMHYPSDVLGGATVGTAFAYMIHSWPW